MHQIDPEVLKVFGFWGSVLVLKVMVMAPLTARQRFRKNVFANQEDAALNAKKGSKVVFDDPDVERVRRAHLNDLENVLPWMIITYIWLGTNPSAWLATILIRTFVLARVAHTISYVTLHQQPLRAIAFFVGFVITGYEALTSLIHYL